MRMWGTELNQITKTTSGSWKAATAGSAIETTPSPGEEATAGTSMFEW